MAPSEQRDALVDLTRAQAKLDALRLRVLAEADRSGATDTEAAASAAAWLAVETQQVQPAVRADLKLAQALESHRPVSTAMSARRRERAAGTGDREGPRPPPRRPAPTPSPTEQHREAEAYLVGLARHHDAKALAILGARIFEVIAPEVAEEFEGKVLADQEAAALRRTTLTMREDDEGTCHGRFRIPMLHGHMLRKFLLSIANPVRQPADSTPAEDDAGEGAASATGIDPDLPADVRHGVALCQLLEAIPGDWVPQAGGVTATVVVTMTLEQLLADLDRHGVCTLDTGGRISAGEARRLACTAGIIPAVLGGKSQVLDLGRRRRLHTPGQRLAMSLRDKGCTAQGCDKPPSMCHAHHDRPWSSRWRHQPRQRATVVRAPPPPDPRHQLRTPPRTHRHRHLPPADVNRTAASRLTWVSTSSTGEGSRQARPAKIVG